MKNILLIISIFFLAGCDSRDDIAPMEQLPDSPLLADIIEGEWLAIDSATGCLTSLFFSPDSNSPGPKFSLSSLNLILVGTYEVRGDVDKIDFDIGLTNDGLDCSGRLVLERGEKYTAEVIVASENDIVLHFPVWVDDHNDPFVLRLSKNDKKNEQQLN